MTGQIAHNSYSCRKFSLLVAGLIAFAVPTLNCQVAVPAAATSAQPVLTATEPIKPISFEIVSIRPSVPGRSQGNFFTDDGYIRRGITPHTLLVYMSKTLSGVPDWCFSERYDVVAKVAEDDVPAWKNMNFKQKSLAMRPMLEDRFKLKWHTETRMESGYELVIAKNGSKLKEATADETYTNGMKEKDGTPLHGVFLGTPSREAGLTGQAANMEQITYYLQQFAMAPVVDRTGLAGTYDFTLRAAREPNPSIPAPATPVNEGPSLFPAIQQQLGLKLVPGKVPVEYVVVDHIERPTAN